MATAGRNEKRPDFRKLRPIPPPLLLTCRLVARVDTYQIHTEARGPHWVAWLTRDAETKPDRGVLLVAASREEAESRAHEWASRLKAAR